MRDEIVGNFYNIYDAIFPTVNILDLTDGIYKSVETTYEQAQSNQLNWLLDQINCKEGSAVLDIGCGYGTLLEEALKRKAYAEGISISEKHVEFCLKKGFVVSLLNYKDINIHKWGNRYDGIIANGSMEHFVKPEEADQADQIYKNFFKICHRIINSESPSGKLATTVIHFNRFYPSDPLALTKNPFKFPLFSEDFHAAIVQRAMGCFSPSIGQLEKCAKPLFRLVEEVDGTEDYRKTSEEWLSRVRKGYLSPLKIPGIFFRLAPHLFRYPSHTITAISFVLTESWNKMFRGENPPMKLLRQVWEYKD